MKLFPFQGLYECGELPRRAKHIGNELEELSHDFKRFCIHEYYNADFSIWDKNLDSFSRKLKYLKSK